jgi:hypothetical protein
MGTSSDHPGGSGGSWTKARNSARNWAGSGGGSGPGLALLVANAAGALTGHAAAAAPTAAARPLARIGGLGGGPGAPPGETLNQSLVRNGLENLAGKSPTELHGILVDFIAGDPQDRDADLVRDAADEAVGDLLDDADDLDNLVIDPAVAAQMMQRFVTGWLTRLIVRELGTVLTDANPHAQGQRVAEIRDYIFERVASVTDSLKLGEVDWSGPEGTSRARRILDDAREVFDE